jgi:hypothetical protein
MASNPEGAKRCLVCRHDTVIRRLAFSSLKVLADRIPHLSDLPIATPFRLRRL